MNDFLQLQTRSLTPYIFATATICMITVIAAAIISWREIRVMKRKTPITSVMRWTGATSSLTAFSL